MRAGVLRHSEFDSYLFFLTPLSLLSNYSLPSLIRRSPKIVRTSPILGQGPTKRYKKDRETRKVEIGRLEREEAQNFCYPKKFLEEEFRGRNHLKELVS